MAPRLTAKKIAYTGKVAMLAGPAGAQAFIRFAKGYQDTMAKYPNIKIAFKHELLLTRENGLKYGEDALVAHPDLKAIYGANDELGMGAAQAELGVQEPAPAHRGRRDQGRHPWRSGLVKMPSCLRVFVVK